MTNTDYKFCETYGSYYKVAHNCIWQIPAMEDGSMPPSSNIDDEEIFIESRGVEDAERFTKEMVDLFGMEVLQTSTIKHLSKN